MPPARLCGGAGCSELLLLLVETGELGILVTGRSPRLCAMWVRLVPAGNKALGTPAVARAGSSLLHCFCTTATAAKGQHFESLRSRFWGRKKSIASQQVPRIVPRFPRCEGEVVVSPAEPPCFFTPPLIR